MSQDKNSQGLNVVIQMLQETVNSMQPYQLMQYCKMTYNRRHDDVKRFIQDGKLIKLESRELLNLMIRSGIFSRLAHAPKPVEALKSDHIFEALFGAIQDVMTDENVRRCFRDSKLFNQQKRYAIAANTYDFTTMKVSDLMTLCRHLAINPVDAIQAKANSMPEQGVKDMEDFTDLIDALDLV